MAIESPAQRVSLIWNGDNEVGRTADENARRDALERMGFETRWDSPNNGQSWWTTYAATGNGLFNAIYVLGTTDTDTLGDKLRSVGCPILSENPALDDNVGFSDAGGNSSLGLWIDVQTAAHPITATSGAGALHVYDSSQKIAMLQGTPAPSLVSLATRTSQTCLAAIESGGALANTVGGNATAAARRVRLPFGGENTPVDWSAVNAAGLELLEQSVLWATAATYTPGSSEGVLVMLTDDNGVLSEGETFRVRRLAYWGFTVVLLWDGAGQADYDAAIATADAVYVPGLADASDVGDKLRECPIGVVYEKGGLDDNLGLSNQEGSADSSNSSQVADRTHPIVANFRDGENLGFFNRFSYENNNWPGSSESLSRLAGTLAPDLWVAMTRGGVPVLATLDTGQDLANNVGGNTEASGRRVRLPWVDDADLTLMRSWSAGSQVLYNALRWAAGPYGGELVVHYKFEPVVGTTVTDHSGKGYYGDARGGVTMNVSPAPRSLAANFDANGEHVYHAPTSHFRDLAKNNGDCTIAFWVRPHEPTQTNWRNLLHVGGADANDRGPLVMLNASNQRPSCWFSTTAISTGAGSTCATLLNNDQWQHVAIVKSGYYVRWYVDGKYVNASRLQGESVATAGELRVGHDGWWGQPDADMDDVRLYNYALADSQITELYAGLVGHFVLDDGAGAEAVDSSVFENTATLQGDPTWDTDDPSLVLDGAGDHALAPSGGQYDLDSDLTIAAWVRVADPDQSRYMRIFSRKSAWSANDGYELEYNPALNRLTLGGRDRQQLAAWGVDLGDEWAHVAATLTSVAGGKYRARLYLNGVELTNVTAWSANPSTMAVDNFDQLVPGTQNLAIGANPSGGDAFNGALRDVRLYRYALNDDQMFELGGGGLLLRLAFDETSGTSAADSSPFGNHATVASGSPSWEPAVVEGGASFDGDNTFVSDRPFSPPATGTVAFWMRRSTRPATIDRLFGVNGDWEVRQGSDGLLSFDLGVSPYVGYDDFRTLEPIGDDNRWVHVAATFDADSDSYKIYLNGALHRSATHSRDMSAQPAGTLTIGDRAGANEPFEGQLDDLRVYVRQLSEEEITELYGLVGHWRLDEIAGDTVAVDETVFAQDGEYVRSPILEEESAYPSDDVRTAVRCEPGDYVQIDNAKHLEVGHQNEDFSVAYWLKNNREASGQWRETVKKHHWGRERTFGMWLRPWDNRMHVRISTEHSWNEGTDTVTAFDVGAWRHVAYVKRNNQLRVYVDGVLERTHNLNGATYSNNGHIYLGVRGTSWRSDVSIDDFRVYQRALNDWEVAELHGLVGWYRMEELSGATITDSSGVKNHGVVVGSSASWPTDAREGIASIELDGTNHIETGSLPVDGPGAAAAGWVKFDAVDTGGGELVSLGDHLVIRLDEGWGSGTNAFGYANSSWQRIYTNTDYKQTGWKHFAVSYRSDLRELSFFIDGILQGQQTLTGDLQLQGLGSKVTIGQHGNGQTDRNVTGLIDDVRVYNRPISRAEARGLFFGDPTPGLRIVRWSEVANP